MQKIIIFGGQGRTGSEVTNLALKLGYEVSVFTFKDSGLFTPQPNLKIIEGNARNFDDVSDALAGHTAVINIIAPRLMDKNNYDISAVATKNILAGMKKHDIRRYQGQSGAWATEHLQDASLPMRLGFMFVPMFRGIYGVKKHEDTLVKASELNWTLVRCGLLTNKGTNPNIRVFKERYKCGLFEIPTISRKSVADFHLDILEDNEYYQQAPLIIN